MSETEHEPTGRSVALEAVIRVAISEVGERSYRQNITSPRVSRELEGSASDRTVRRAMKDAESLNWIQKKKYGNEFEPGEKAVAIATE